MLYAFNFSPAEGTRVKTSPPELASANDSKKKLLILDLNGVLLGSPFTRMTRNRDFNFRPPKVSANLYLNCFVNYNVHKFFCYDQSRCTMTQTSLGENPDKKVMFKDLQHVWGEYKSYNSSNTILVDDSPYKSFLNSPYNAIFPISYTCYTVEDNYLDPEGDFVRHLKKLASADNVQDFIKRNRFGQSPVTEGSVEWNFYVNVVSKLGLQNTAKRVTRKREAPNRYYPEVSIAFMFRNMFTIVQHLVMIAKIASAHMHRPRKKGKFESMRKIIVHCTEASPNLWKASTSLLMGHTTKTFVHRCFPSCKWFDGTGNIPSSLDIPLVLDVTSGWKVVLHEENGSVYYWNIETGETSWEVRGLPR
ncbi:unnamed protein product [Coffea canephora]|uniref:DH200=94 genomic scaffold, scaffold_2168 n=1 Tax=Coffea canephora TaxID=49390 RepID=A0A068VK30_COFCA|nr:unnamed protein product [Coffea canephora]